MNAWHRRALTALGLIALCVVAQFTFKSIVPDTAYRNLISLALVYVVVALSLNVINGMAGQFSIGHAGFVGIGAYTSAIVASNIHAKLGGGYDYTFANSFLVMPPAILAGAAMAAVFGLLVGLPSLRLRGDYLAIVTLGFAEIFRLIIATNAPGPDKTGIRKVLSQLGGPQGYSGPEGSNGVAQYAGPFWLLGGLFLSIIIAWRLKFSGWGRALRALREDEIAASAVGVDPTNYKVTSFVISSMGAGVAGALWAGMADGNPTVNPDQFNFAFSFDAITMVILGGSGSVSGAVIGGLFVTVTVKMIEQLQRLETIETWRYAHPDFDLNALRMVVYATVLIVLMIVRPSGIFGENEISFFRKREARGKPPVSPKNAPA